jgi:hypothetical protein
VAEWNQRFKTLETVLTLWRLFPLKISLLKCFSRFLSVKESVMTTVAENEVLKMARMTGARAPVIAVPDPTVDGIADWKQDLLVYFGCAADNLIHEVGAKEEMRGEILAAMKEGFEELLISQPYEGIPFPLNARDKETEKAISLRVLKEVFEELPGSPHHCTR